MFEKIIIFLGIVALFYLSITIIADSHRSDVLVCTQNQGFVQGYPITVCTNSVITCVVRGESMECFN